jgi:hypothetical protein
LAADAPPITIVRMEQKQWEHRLDRVADRVAEGVKDGVRVLENAYDKGREGVMSEVRGSEADATPKRGSPRLGLILVGLGIVWLLHSLGILDQPVFPILLIVLGVYFIARSK